MLPNDLLPQRPRVAPLVRALFGRTLSTSPRSIAYALSRGGVPLLLQCLLLPIHLLPLPAAAVVDSRPELSSEAGRC
jgi:energy-coupling factor transporter transmembrane protein EcfT